MIKNSKEKEFLNKQEWGTRSEATKQTRIWPTLRNPRVVRVSQTFGGKDRHSKVSTIRGLRDRRVRLSVPTAIQLYDLQDKLGLNQPSKVVDWLLNASQQEIDKLPPLPLFPENFIQFPQSLASSSTSAVNEEKINENAQTIFVNDQLVFTNNFVGQNVWNNSDEFLKSRSGIDDNKGNGGKYDDDEIDSTTAAYTFFHQFEPNLSQEEVPQGFPSAFSLYGNNHNNFQIPTTFAQLLPLSSARTSLQAGREHERKQ